MRLTSIATRRLTGLLVLGVSVAAALYGCSSDETTAKPTTSTTTDGGGGSDATSSTDSGGTKDTGTTTTPDTGTVVDAGPKTALASIQPTTVGGTASGSATFVENAGGGATVTITIAGASPGPHGIHIHANGDCSTGDAGTPDGAAPAPGTGAGPHWNSLDASHGYPDAAVHHIGDMGNIEIGAGGSGTLVLTNPNWTVTAGPNSVVGHAIIFHNGVDDGVSQPAGDAGSRGSCGIIAAN
ncbi:MAG: superoxide dismutase family protein [Myxococcales bacterium]|nr:superoxide dismutase family protein [Myxococcales bacterium]